MRFSVSPRFLPSVIVRFLLILFLIGLTWVIYITNTGQYNAYIQFVKNLPYGDKFSHFFLAGFLTLLANLSTDCKTFRIGKRGILVGTTLVAALVFLEECSQLFIPVRKFSLWDLLSDFLGISTFNFLSLWLHSFRQNRK